MADNKVKEIKMAKTTSRVRKTVRVTQDIINRSVAMLQNAGSNRAEQCPVALAMRKLRLPYATSILVAPGRVMSTDYLLLAKLPPRAKTFIFTFDMHKPVRPFRFDIRLPKEI